MDSFERLLAQQQVEKHSLVVSRHWGHPEIRVSVNQDKIELVAKLDDFIDAITEDIANPALILTRRQLREKLMQAAAKALEKVKEASAQVM